MLRSKFFFLPPILLWWFVYERCIFFLFCSLIGFVDFVVCIITRFVVFIFYFFIGFVGSEPWVVILWWLVFFSPWFSYWSWVFCVMGKFDLFCFVVWVILYIHISLHKFDDDWNYKCSWVYIINKVLIYLHTKLRCFRALREFATSIN